LRPSHRRALILLAISVRLWPLRSRSPLHLLPRCSPHGLALPLSSTLGPLPGPDSPHAGRAARLRGGSLSSYKKAPARRARPAKHSPQTCSRDPTDLLQPPSRCSPLEIAWKQRVRVLGARLLRSLAAPPPALLFMTTAATPQVSNEKADHGQCTDQEREKRGGGAVRTAKRGGGKSEMEATPTAQRGTAPRTHDYAGSRSLAQSVGALLSQRARCGGLQLNCVAALQVSGSRGARVA